MSPAITVANVTWQTPEGRRIFSGLDLSLGYGRTGLVGRNGTGKTTLLRMVAGELMPAKGSISRTGTVAIVRQTLQVGARETVADLFGIATAMAVLRRAEEGKATLEEYAEADWMLEERVRTALESVGLAAEADTPLIRLSGGQRTRAALAGALFRDPDFLLLDEPTNNLDQDGREVVRALVASWRKGAIVVSHDRKLLEEMDAIVELTGIGATRYGGNYSAYRERKALELAAAERELAEADRRMAEVRQSAQANAERQQRRDAGGRRKASKGDMPKVLLGARKNRAQGTSGSHARLAERQRANAAESLAAARERVEMLQPIALSLPPTGLPVGKTVLILDHVTAGHGPEAPVIEDLSFTVTGPERIAVAGPNGSGKTTLLQLLTGDLRPWSGDVRLFVKAVMLDQKAAVLDPVLTIRDNFLRMNAGSTENACRAALARFAFRADAALQTAGTLSGGQMLRAALACVLGGEESPQLLILDEPTNHLDLESVQAIEAGLQSYDGALLVASHDAAFLEALRLDRRLTLPTAKPAFQAGDIRS
ncbi:ABC-F family ATP-binding cassette domain-containing protein [Sphingosinicella sp. CPCC 101087]|uniref:ABC-F family ATP-binding cassette domain-containing protein n=1 Tax=Sphingosinicella sp. CPCC 101087 TaxID=2497754 RepID=UPI00101DEF1D|nr:ABC-F family ATP-binding cassette domain-containing protein [Sphingosinicella sp. CPCC 101087]